jgi:hypothetical protein
MAERTKYQQSVIRNFYQNREAIAVQRLQELATELYLVSGKKRDQLWKQLRTHMETLRIDPARIEYVIGQQDPALVAKVAQEYFAK